MMNLPAWLPRDKMLHAVGGTAVVAATLLVLAVAKHDVGFSLAASATLVGLAYEWVKKFRGEGEFSLLDAAATAAPGFAVWGALAAFGLR